jgi:hypothetical protein
MMQAGVILSDYATLMIEILKDNARPEASAVYGAIEMDWAELVGQTLAKIASPSKSGSLAMFIFGNDEFR